LIQIQNDKNLQTNTVSDDKEKLKRYFEMKQQRLTEAYEILSHPNKRSLYDAFGKVEMPLVKVEGLDADELMETINAHKREKRRADREMKTNASTQTIMNLDASELVRSLIDPESEPTEGPVITIPSTSMSQNFQVCAE
jgi:curved DNA-binding protein CbpA